MPNGRGLPPKLNKTEKSLPGKLLAVVEQYEAVAVGAAASAVVALASDFHIVISKASVASVLTPLATSVLVELNKKLGIVGKVTGRKVG